MTQAKYQMPALFFMLAAAMLAAALLSQHLVAMDLYVHDTYYVISHTFIFWVLSVYFVACALLYLVFEKVTRKRMSPGLGDVHFWLSTIAVGILVHTLHKMSAFGTDVARAQAAMHSLAEVGFVAFFGFFIAQIVFVANVIWSLFRTQSSTSTEP